MVPEVFLLSKYFCKIFPFAKLCDDVEIIFSFENSLQSQQVLRRDVFDFLKDVNFIVGKLSMEVVLLFDIDDLYCYEFVRLIVFALVYMGAVSEADFVR